MEKTSTELFNDEIEYLKRVDEATRKRDELEKDIILLRNELDKIQTDLRTKIRNKEAEIREWQQVIRTNKLLAQKARSDAWAARHSGL